MLTQIPTPLSSIVDVDNLTVEFHGREGTVRPVNGVAFSLKAGEVLCILGESGSGKSVTLRALMRLLAPDRTRISGHVEVAGHDVLAASGRSMAALRGSTISMIFQEP